MIEYAHSWLGVALPILTRKEALPVVKAALHLCRVIFSSATDTPEFQRQVSTPNVPKFTTALIHCLENSQELELKVLALKTLTRLIPLYPNVHRANYASLSSITLHLLSEQPDHVTTQLMKPASELYSVLHLTGGKVGAATLWRKALDERTAAAWAALSALRTTFPDSPKTYQAPVDLEDPSVWIPLNSSRLHSSVLSICDLLRTTTSRPVQIPIGPLAKLASALMTVTADEQAEGHIEPTIRAMEVSVVPEIWAVGCELTTCLAKATSIHFMPYLTRFCTYIAFHLEQKLKASERIPFLSTLQTLLTYCHFLDATILSTRLTRVILSTVSTILPSQFDLDRGEDARGTSIKSKKGKKRARGYEGDEVFRNSLGVICPSKDDGKVLLTACDVMGQLLQISEVAPALHSLAFSVDVQVYHEITKRIRDLALQLSEGTTSAMGKSLSLVVHTLSTVGYDERSLHELDLLLHPRLPPLLRSLPQVEALSLFRTEESEEEKLNRQDLGLEVEASEEHPQSTTTRADDIIMADSMSEPIAPTIPSEPQPPTNPTTRAIPMAAQDATVPLAPQSQPCCSSISQPK
ncbi:hypothetical protein VNI00_001219 [Paramarasmius palmivorus]|uniref:Pre-rRNA-processing protein RIX1 n=1 Tax=Paramarasmius palmivorus TaxID=297713 RepID=A0AAW0E8L4_9AGAR